MWIAVTTYNRPEYTTRSFESLAKTPFPPDTHLVIMDDHSEDQTTVNFIHEFSKRTIPNLTIDLVINPGRIGCDLNMLQSIRYALDRTKDQFVITTDNDAIYNPQWMNVMLRIVKDMQIRKARFGALSVFNTKMHPFILNYNDEIGIKKDIGSLGSIINRVVFDRYNFNKPLWPSYGWDWNMSWGLKKKFNLNTYCTRKSYIDHIGKAGEHSDGKTSFGDFAENFVGELC